MVNHIYRNLLPMTELVERGHEVYICQGSEPEPERLLDFDVVCFWRAYDPTELQVARMLRRAGVPVIWDDDDDAVGIPKSNPSYKKVGASGLFKYRRRIVEIMRCASLVTSPSETLCRRFHEASGTPVRVIENYLPNDFAAKREDRKDTVTVGWVAGQEHRIDSDRLELEALLARLLDELPQMRLVTVGLKLGLRNERYEYILGVEHHDLPAVLCRFDIGLAPLVDVRFNQARSNVKLKEYAASGVPWLASPIGPYVGMGEEQGGRPVADDGWEDALRELVQDGRARRKLSKRAAKWAKGQTIGRNVQRWEAVLTEAIELGALTRA